MNNEIKKALEEINILGNTILNDTTYKPTINRREALYNYITNLQQELQEANDSVEWWSNRFKAVERDNRELTQENEELKKKLDRRYYKNEYERIKQENKELKDIVVEKDNQIKEMILQKTDYTAVNILEMKLEDCKSRCEKAIEYIDNSDILDIHHKNRHDLLNILQNGSEENVSDRN